MQFIIFLLNNLSQKYGPMLEKFQFKLDHGGIKIVNFSLKSCPSGVQFWPFLAQEMVIYAGI